MPYATEQDIIDLYGSDTLIISADRDGDGEADDGVAAAALDAASDEIDSYISERYEVPVSPVPVALRGCCIDIALYRMSVGAAVTDEKRKRYEDALNLLKRVSDGKCSFSVAGKAPAAVASGACFTAGTRLFGRDRME